jgi:hypothetical protein
MPETNDWLTQHNARVGDVEHVIVERRGFEEVVLHLDGGAGPLQLLVSSSPTARPPDVSRSCASTSATGR